MFRKDKQFMLNFASVIGVGLTMASTIIDTRKASKFIDDDMTLQDKIKATWQCYIPSGLIATSTILCIMCADQVAMNEKITLFNTLIATQYKYKTLRESVVNNCDDETKDQIIKSNIRNKIPKDIYLDRTEDKYFYEDYLGDFFVSSIDSVLKAEYLLNKQLYITGTASLNDFYQYLGVSKIDGCDDIGWTIDGYHDMDEDVDSIVSFIHREISDESGLEFNYIGYHNEPRMFANSKF